MALDITAGTETLRVHHLKSTGTSALPLIYGEQHHIYTILSIIVNNITWGATSTFDILIEGFNINAAGSGQDIGIIKNESTGDGGTFIWNDKFCLNGFEPTGYSGSMSASSQADLVAAQGGLRQRLLFRSDSASNYYDVTCTFIDQNNE